MIALTIARDSADESAERTDVRTARCEHHDHDGRPASKWLGKFKRIKYYGPSKSQHRQKTHYGQPNAHFRPPPQYVRTQTNYNLPSFHPLAAIAPETSYPQLNNPNGLPQYYSPLKIYSSPPQVQSFNHPAHLPHALTQAPPTDTSASYPQEPEEFEEYSVLALVPQVPVSPVKIRGYPSYPSLVQSFNRPAHSPLASTVAPVPSTYSNAPDPQDPEYHSPPAQVGLSSVQIHDYPTQAQKLNRSPESSASTEAQAPSTHSNAPYAQDPVNPETPTAPVNNPPPSYSPPRVPVSTASYDPPSPNHLEIPDPDPPAITSPVSTEATANHTASYSNPLYAGNYSLSTAGTGSQDVGKPKKVLRSSRRPTYAPSTYSSPVTTERAAPTSPSYNDFENPPVGSTPAFYPSPHTPSYNNPSAYSPPVTEAPEYFPSYFGGDFDSHHSYDDPYPQPPLRKPTSYSPPKFTSHNSPSYDPPFFMDSPIFSPPVYSEEPFQKSNSRPSAEIPDNNSNEDEEVDEKEFFHQGSFPRFDEFVKQMMSIGKK